MQKGPRTQGRRRLGGVFAILALLAFLFQPAARAASPRQVDRIDALLGQMTTRQKVAQMFVVSLWGEALTLEAQAFLASDRPGGVVLFSSNIVTPDQITSLTNAIQTELTAGAPAIPAWIATDQEGGTVSRLEEGFTTLPVPMAVAATADPAYAQALGQAMAQELRAVGINMDLAPVSDVLTNPANPVVARRAFSADPGIAAEMVAALVEGLQSGGVLATAKHFPGHGETSTDSHLTLPVVSVDRVRLDAVELVPFEAAIRADVGAIMAAHVWYPALDPTPNTPASLSEPVLTGLLRGELGYQGLIMTDALDMDAIDLTYSLSNAALRAIAAGVDLITPGPHVSIATQQAAIDAVTQAVDGGQIPLARIEDSVRRILRLKAAYGLLDWTPLDPAGAETRIDRATHEALIADILAHALTLVYDRGAVIPLDTSRRLLLIYPATQPSIARNCATYAPAMQVIGVSLGPTEEEIAWASGAARQADLAIVFTYNAQENVTQQRLVRALDPARTVVVALHSPYDWQAFPDVAAYLTAYSPLPPAIPAACAGLFGAQPITGRLPITLGAELPAGSGLSRP